MAVLGGIIAQASVAAFAQTWHLEPSVAVQETLTNNVNLSPSGSAQGDLVLLINTDTKTTWRFDAPHMAWVHM